MLAHALGEEYGGVADAWAMAYAVVRLHLEAAMDEAAAEEEAQRGLRGKLLGDLALEDF